MITGKATPQATTLYGQEHFPLTYSLLNGTGLRVSQVGFGCYRVTQGEEQYEQALQQAILRGINLIDTSSNYADGGSEQLVGDVIGQLINKEQLTREALVIVSKVGYLQGQNYNLSQERKLEGNPFPDLVEYADGLEHCIHPEFLADQLTRSLKRLKMDCIDCYLLHNPEYYLGWAHKQGIPLNKAREEYYRRLTLALHHLEQEVADGRIQWYGISSNTFPSHHDDPQFTSLERVWAIAEAIAPDHHCRLIQLPMNLMETGAITEHNQTNGRSVLTLAQEKELAVLINRPLNAFTNNTLIRLVDVPAPNYPTTPEEVSTLVDSLVEAEKTFQRDILPRLPLTTTLQQQLLHMLAIGRILQGHWQGIGTYQNWRDVQSQYLIPRAQTGLKFLSNWENLPVAGQNWIDGYVEKVNTTLAAVEAIYQARGAKQSAQIKQQAVAVEAEWATETLSRTAIRALRSTAGITTVLVGMRRVVYVDDVMADLVQGVVIKNRDTAWTQLAQVK